MRALQMLVLLLLLLLLLLYWSITGPKRSKVFTASGLRPLEGRNGGPLILAAWYTVHSAGGGIGLRHRPEPVICSDRIQQKSNSAGDTLVKFNTSIIMSVARSSGRSKSHTPTSDRLRNNGRTHVRAFSSAYVL